jgi:hypothetical protein
MPRIHLSPTIHHLSQEYLLVPAWKKAHDYIRHQNWYSDVLELDLTNADLGDVIRQIGAEVKSEAALTPTPLRLILAPKSQSWKIKNDKWLPVGGSASVATKLRPLAHVCVRDQIISTGFMILLADLVETRQGDPRKSPRKAHEEGMVSYGHRLFCDQSRNQLHFRWGNAGVYRQFYQDYQNFIARPEQMIADHFEDGDTNWAVVSADLSQFYDRVRPELLHEKVRGLLGNDADETFLAKFSQFFNWEWHASEETDALRYAHTTQPNKIEDYDRIALPQGLVASGFFSNVILLDFDDSIVASFDEWNDSAEWQLVDYCRYVDDMRFVVRLAPALSSLETQSHLENRLIDSVTAVITSKLAEHAPALVVNPGKCDVVLGRNAGAGSIRLSSSMRRINHNASGVMDLFVGEETLEMIETLLYSSEAGSVGFENRFQDTILAAKPDVRDTTVARFAANRFRKAYRTLRPMVDSTEHDEAISGDVDVDESDDWNVGRFQLGATLSRESLDQKAFHFASRLVERWIRDPSNMRLLRVAFDLYPESRTLGSVLELLNEYIGANTRKKAPRRVAWYCAAELLKAGATETGLVNDDDELPSGIDIARYQDALATLAKGIVERKTAFPWYLVQQAYLYLACFGQYVDQRITSRSNPTLRSYILLHKALNDRYSELPHQDVPNYALLHSNLRSPKEAAVSFVGRLLTEDPTRQHRWLTRILSEHRILARAVWETLTVDEQEPWADLFSAYGVIDGTTFPTSLNGAEPGKAYSLLDIAGASENPFQQEYAALHFASKLIPSLEHQTEPVTPNRVFISSTDWNKLRCADFPLSPDAFRVEIVALPPRDTRFRLPEWISPLDGWKYQLGMLLRVLLTGIPDYTMDSRSQNPQSKVVYAPLRSSWLRRRYGMFNGRNAFGPPWTPISSWFGALLNKLLEWPGFPDHEFELHLPQDCDVATLQSVIQARMSKLESMYGVSSRMPLLPIRVPKVLAALPGLAASARSRSLHSMRVGVAQTVLPRFDDFTKHGVDLLARNFRRRHRRHTAAVLSGIQRMLQVRTTHQEIYGGIELLVLPELSIHPLDVRPLLVPFVKQNKCIVCAGMVFQKCSSVPGFVNSAVWLIPIRKPSGGLDVELVYQGKRHMTIKEETCGIMPFRPAQWVFELIDLTAPNKPLWAMTGAVCYDATDLSLAADLREHTDLFVIPALNQDVGTFDNMAAALHYHMFQHVIVANTGEYGGSSAQAPFDEKYRRTIFHLHGNDQVGISFFEVDFGLYRTGRETLKTPPANHQRARRENS